MATLGESYFGVARGAESVLYVSAGVGLGGGIVLDGRLMPGAAGFAGEVGHMTVDPRRPALQLRQPGLLGNPGQPGRGVPPHPGAPSAAGAGTRACWSYTRGDPDALTIPLVVRGGARPVTAWPSTPWKKRACTWASASPTWSTPSTRRLSSLAAFSAWRAQFLMPVVQRVIARARAALVGPLDAPAGRPRMASDACVMGGIATVYHQILSQPFKSRPISAVRASESARV